MDTVEKIAATVLYEGYLLFPYRLSALKNQQRWTFGGVYPRRYSEAGGGNDPWSMQTQCLVTGDQDTALEVTVRFLHLADRHVLERVAASPGGAMRPVESLRVGTQVYRPLEEAIERTVVAGGSDGSPLRLGDLIARGRRIAIAIPAGSTEEPLTDSDGHVAGALVRVWRSLQGAVEIAAAPLDQSAERSGPGYRLTVRIVNTAPWPPEPSETDTTLERPWHRRLPGGSLLPASAQPSEEATSPHARALRHTFISTHTILRVRGGAFVSQLEPPPEYHQAAERCANLKTWPVLVGEQGERHTLLSSPIILYDYPQIAPESPGDYFDTTEIDELLALSVMTLTDDEKQELRESDGRARGILERTETLSPEQLLKLHGAVRSLQPVRREGQ